MNNHVCFACDHNYVKYSYLAAYSLLQNRNNNTTYTIHILSDITLNDEDRQRFQSLEIDHSNCTVDIIIVNYSLDSSLIEDHLAIPTYYRLLAAELFENVDTLLYLDSDILINDDISGLFEYNMDDNLLYGVKQIGNRLSPDGGVGFCKDWDIDSLDYYINAGVLLMNLKRIREENLTDRFIEMAPQRKWPGSDQFILNKICYGRIGFLPYRYNIGIGYFYKPEVLKEVFDKEEIEEGQILPAIVHYAEIKPWRWTNIPLSNLWWDMAKKTEYYQEYLQDYMKWQNNPPKFNRFPNLELDNLLTYCRGQRIIIYGAGYIGKKICQILKDRYITPWSFAVTDINNVENDIILGVPVCDIQSLGKYSNKSFVLIASEFYYEEMEATLNKNGFTRFQRIYKEWLC